jgi:ketosteroid isomerase-like protein
MKANEKTEKEIKYILEKFIEAISRHDLEDVMSFLAPDDDLVVYGAEPEEKRIGLDNIRKALEENWLDTDEMDITLNWISISAAENVAWVASDTCVEIKTYGQHLIFPSRFTMIFEKRLDKWLIVNGHFSFPTVIPHLSFF